jgi:ATP-binding cassette subfamily B protein
MLLRIMVRAPFLAIGSLVMAFAIHAKLALILLAAIPILFAVLYYIIRIGFPLFTAVQEKLDNVNTVLRENLAGIRVVKAFVRAGFEIKRFRATNDDYMATAVKANMVMATMMPVMFFLLNGSIVAVLWFGGQFVWDNSILVGDLVAFINYVTQVLFSLLMVGMMLMGISRAKASSDRIVEVLETEPDIRERENARDQVIREGRIEFDRVSFSYEKGESILKEISFTAEPGRTVAILGATGAGKSTLVHLIPRLYEVAEGSVRIDGIDVRDIKLRHLRSRIGIVLQESILFSGTIRDNIRYGRPDAGQEEVEAAAKAAEAHDFIMQMPDGYDSVIGQKGVTLSGGQKQRIAIARALLMKPAVLIMDDSTSAVDLGTESRIRKALKQLMRHSTNLIIAQRISSVMDADKIIVLDEGRIVAEGTHAELLAESDVYQDIYRSQQREGDAIHV